jgi:hypothetical protein
MSKENWRIIGLIEIHTTHGFGHGRDIQEPVSTIDYPYWAQQLQYCIKFVINTHKFAWRCTF